MMRGDDYRGPDDPVQIAVGITRWGTIRVQFDEGVEWLELDAAQAEGLARVLQGFAKRARGSDLALS